MAELFTLYNTEVIIAPCDGMISGIDTSSPQLLSAMTEEAEATELMYSGTEEAIYGITRLSNTTVAWEEETTVSAATESAPTESEDSQNAGTDPR